MQGHRNFSIAGGIWKHEKYMCQFSPLFLSFPIISGLGIASFPGFPSFHAISTCMIFDPGQSQRSYAYLYTMWMLCTHLHCINRNRGSKQLYKIHVYTCKYIPVKSSFFTYSHIIIVYSGILNLYLLWYICHWTLRYKQKLYSYKCK